MNISEIFKDSLNYAKSDVKKVLILGILLVVASLYKIFSPNSIMYLILAVVAVIIGFISLGYALGITRNAIAGSNEVPNLDIASNLNDGLKAFVVDLVYGIIIGIISIILLVIVAGIGYLSGSFNRVIALVNNSANLSIITLLSDPSIIMALLIFGILVFIVVFLFGILANISICRLAKTGRIGEALKFKQVIADIKKIGFGNYLKWYIVLCFICIIIGLIIALIGIIPYVGLFIGILIFSSFTLIFVSRAMGLLYAQIEYKTE